MNWETEVRPPLFAGVREDEMDGMLACLGARRKNARKGEAVLYAGSVVRELGIVLRGSVDVTRVDYWGGVSLIARIGEGETFAETYAVLGEPLAVDVTAAAETELIFLDAARILSGCGKACARHSRLARNFAALLAQKNLVLARKADVLAQRTTREKLLTYLSAQAQAAGADVFTIPFTRQQLADYLAVDRSAMTVELGRLARDGVLRFEKNKFELL